MLRWTLDRRAILRLGLTGAGWALWERIGAARLAHAQTPLRDPRERHLGAIRQLTFGGLNAEAYFDPTGTRLVFQSTRPPFGCDQIFTMNTDGGQVRLVSTGRGRTTCAYFYPDQPRILYSTTQFEDAACPPAPDRSRGYVWPAYPSYDIVSADLDGRNLRRLTQSPGYDAEAAISADGRSIVFCSARDGDLDLFLMDAGGGNVRRLTDRPGYDGGPFFSWDGRSIVYRSYYPETTEAREAYRADLARHQVRPAVMDLYVMAAADGGEQRRVLGNGAANFAPFMLPDSTRIIFSSNLHDPTRRSFALYLVHLDGTGLERVTYAEEFASFPMISKDGTKLVFCSTRNASGPREINVFIADWIP
ncbi:MAG: PD40 domain-containing protein [candidate division NC10 bacterium]|nr:PD40 domain-containing protein [candidate division NC10 bacterium]